MNGVIPDEAHPKTELYDHKAQTWNATWANYDSHSGIRNFQILPYLNGFIIFGGCTKSCTKGDSHRTIAKFDPDLNKWTKIGQLNRNRNKFGIIDVHGTFLVVGGKGGYSKTEKCEITGEKIKCKERLPSFTDWYGYPAMMIAPQDASCKIK